MDKDLGFIPQIAAALAFSKKRSGNNDSNIKGRNADDVNLEIYKLEQKRKFRKNILIGLGITVGVLVSAKKIKKIIKNKTDKENTPDVQFAKRLRTAMSPSGVWWMPDGTDEKGIMEVAKDISNNSEVKFNNVQTAYKRLYNSSLSDDLQSELSTSEYTEFLSLTDDNYDPATDRKTQEYINNKLVITIKDAALFKEKNDTFSYRTIPQKSVFTNVVTTGRYEESGFINKKRIEVKKVDGNIVRWMNFDEIATVSGSFEIPVTNTFAAKLKNKGYKLYKF